MRNLRTILVLALSASISAAFSISYAQELTGREVMERVEAQSEVDDETTIMTMKLINKKGKEQIRQAEQAVKTGDEGTKTLIRFLKPRDIEGTGLLTVEHKEDASDQWLYLPALRRTRRIPSGGRTDSFMGTDFSFEDLSPENLEVHSYKVIRSEEVDGQACYVVEAVPATEKEKKESGYGRRELSVRKDNFLIVQVKYYNKKNEWVKVSHSKDIEEVESGVWRSNTLEMHNVKRNHRTILIIEERKMNQGISDGLFTPRSLERWK